jgi:hypothetical protein
MYATVSRRVIPIREMIASLGIFCPTSTNLKNLRIKRAIVVQNIATKYFYASDAWSANSMTSSVV